MSESLSTKMRHIIARGLHYPRCWDTGPMSYPTLEDALSEANDDFICECELTKEVDADARLIAAAPDLLEAARMALLGIEADELPLDFTTKVQRKLREAIAKAEGGE